MLPGMTLIKVVHLTFNVPALIFLSSGNIISYQLTASALSSSLPLPLPVSYFFLCLPCSLSVLFTDFSYHISPNRRNFSSMEEEEKISAEERRKQARENSRVSEIVNFSAQPETKSDIQDDNELFVTQEEPAAKRPRRTPIPILTNKEIRQSINVGRPEIGSRIAASKSNSFAGFVTSK